MKLRISNLKNEKVDLTEKIIVKVTAEKMQIETCVSSSLNK